MPNKLQETSEKIGVFKQKTQDQFLKNWYVLYTFPKAEKSIYNELLRKNYHAFLPIKKTLKLWANRQMKWVEQVLFPGYIFVNAQPSELYNIIRTPKVVSLISCGGTPSIIASKEIEGIKKMINMDQEISIESNFSKGEKVKIICGPLIGHEGILVKQKGKTRFGILLKEINQTVFIDVNSSMLEKVKF